MFFLVALIILIGAVLAWLVGRRLLARTGLPLRNILYADGSVQWVEYTISPAVWYLAGQIRSSTIPPHQRQAKASSAMMSFDG